MRPGEVFPLPVDRSHTGSVERLEYYVPVELDLAVRGREAYKRWALGLIRITPALEPDDLIPWMQRWIRELDADKGVLLFYLLKYDVTLHYEVDPRRASTYPALRALISEDDQEEIYRILTPATKEFVESIGEALVRLDEKEDYHKNVVWPVFRAQLIILREMAFMIVGGEVIRLGGWLLTWANDLRIVGAIVRRVVLLGEHYRSAKVAIALTSDLFAILKVIGHRALQILDVVGTHDLLLELIPDLVKIERRLAERLGILAGIEEAGASVVDGWVVEDDPVERAFAATIAARMVAASR